MDYEKKYNEALERAKKLSIDGYLDAIAVEEIFPPEESEDERARKAALEGIEYLERKLGWDAIGDTDILDVKEYLEKQKENPKNAISIPADCASNAKCPYKIHGDEDFIGDIKDTPAYHFGFDEGVRSEREKQKEQKPAEWNKQQVVNALTSMLNERITPFHQKSLDGTIGDKEKMFMDAFVEMRSFVNSPSFDIGKENSAEWSEEDERMLDSVIHIITHVDDLAHEPTFAGPKWTHPYTKEIAWLKSLRPSWKPSEEQIQAIKYIVSSIPPNYLKEQKYTMGLVCEVISNLEKL